MLTHSIEFPPRSLKFLSNKSERPAEGLQWFGEMKREEFLFRLPFIFLASVYSFNSSSHWNLSQDATVTRHTRCANVLAHNDCHYLKFGGNSWLHHYICCNNCQVLDNAAPGSTTIINDVCDGTTYQSASSGDYCAPCGLDKGAAGCGESFYCGGCSGQAIAAYDCRQRWWNLHQIPGFCWTFAMCFKEKCLASFKQKSSDKRRKRASNVFNDTTFPNLPVLARRVTGTFCGDAVCQNEAETVMNCPMDCCQHVNPEKCRLNQCPALCCGDSNCCLARVNSSAAVNDGKSEHHSFQPLYYIVISTSPWLFLLPFSMYSKIQWCPHLHRYVSQKSASFLSNCQVQLQRGRFNQPCRNAACYVEWRKQIKLAHFSTNEENQSSLL